jgi:hypothetical protein
MELTSSVNPTKLRNKGGRPNKLTKELQDTICAFIRAGNYIETAAVASGISKDTLYLWLKRGAVRKNGRWTKFSDAVKRALSEYETRDVAAIDKAVNGYEVIKRRALTKKNPKTGEMEIIEQTIETHMEYAPMVALERLRRRFPDRWGGREQIEISGNEDKPLVVQDGVTGKMLAELMVALAEVKLLSPELMQAIDVTPMNGSNGANGAG